MSEMGQEIKQGKVKVIGLAKWCGELKRERDEARAAYQECKLAISSDCGKGYLPPEQVKPLVEALEFCLTHNHADSNGGKRSCCGHECRVCDAIANAMAHAKQLGL